MNFHPHLRILRTVKLLIWALRCHRWERLYDELKAKPFMDFNESEKRLRRLKSLEWKIQGAQERIAKYSQKHGLYTDLSGG